MKKKDKLDRSLATAHFTNTVKNKMYEYELTYRELARQLKIKHSYLHAIINGKRPLRLDVVVQLSRLLRISLDDLLQDYKITPHGEE